MWALEFFVTQELLVRLTGEYPDLHEFDELVGNLPLLGFGILMAAFVAYTHRENIKRKLTLDSAAELSRAAVQWLLENG